MSEYRHLSIPEDASAENNGQITGDNSNNILSFLSYNSANAFRAGSFRKILVEIEFSPICPPNSSPTTIENDFRLHMESFFSQKEEQTTK
jgi:hypothetical protein